MITLSLAKWMQANAPITAITADIKPQILNDDHADPAITYTLIYDEAFRVYAGHSTLFRAEFQVDCYAAVYADSKALANTIRNELQSYVGAFGDHEAQQIDFRSERDMHESQTKLHRVMLEFTLWYNEQQP